MAKTKKPKGVKITRNGNNLYAEWECASEDYKGGQMLQINILYPSFRKVGKKTIEVWEPMWVDIKVGTETRKKKVATVSEWIDNKAVAIHVCGKRKPYTTGSGKDKKTHTPDWSDWVMASISFSEPNVPSVSLSQGASDAQCTMSWSVSGVSATNTKPFDHIEYQTMIIEGKTNDNFPNSLWKSSQKGWGTGTKDSASGSLSINNNVTFTSENSFTRAVRARAVGPAGTSAWSKVAYYTYATPKMVEISKGTAVGRASYRCDVSWGSPATFAHPIDYFHPMYLMGTPRNTSMSIPSGVEFSEAGPNQANHQKAYPFALTSTLGYDEALWFRIDALHGTRTRLGKSYFVMFGGIKPIAESDIYIEYDSETKVLTVGETYSSDLNNPKVKVDIPYYNDKGQIVNTATSRIDGEREFNNYVLPTSVTKVNFKARVEWGDYSTEDITKEFNPRASASPYAYCPTTVNVSKGSAVGSVNMSWNIPLEDATGADIGYSTNQVDWTTEAAINDSSTVVTGIEYDVDYWYRVRLKSSRGETKWSESKQFKLSTSSLAKPTSLAVTKGDMKDNLRVTWRWTDFPTADGIEISWADNPNAWDSSETPSSAQVERTESNGTFYINELERDTTWYVRARFMAAHAFSGAITKSYMLPMITVPPSNVTFERTLKLNTPRISWNWSWDDAESAEISWSDDTGAWTATSGLETATIEDRTRDYLDIAGLETGKIWYAKVKLIYDKYSSESDIVSVDLRTNPETPVITLSDTTIPSTLGKTDISWTYICEDGLPQKSASVWLLDENGDLDRQLAGVSGEDTSVTIYAETYGLEGDTDYLLVVQTTSESGLSSEWSNPASLSVTILPEAHITESSIVTETTGDNPQTYTGEIVQIDNSEDITSVRSLNVSLDPIQDLHGYDKPWSGGAGKNKMPPILTQGSASIVVFGQDNNTDFDIGLKAGTYTISVQASKNVNFYMRKPTDSGNTHIGNYDVKNATFTLESDADIRIWAYVVDGLSVSDISTVQLEQGTTVTAYEPYSNICPISGRTECDTYVSPTTSEQDATVYTTDLGRTVYSGQLDVVSGELVVDRVAIDMSTLNWSYWQQSATQNTFYVNITDKAVGKKNILSSAFDVLASGGYGELSNGEMVGADGNTYVYLVDNRFTNVADFKSAVSGQTLCYELATPQTYQLTPTEVSLLLGQNNVWSDGALTINTLDNVREGNFLKSMPLTLTVTGIGDKGTITAFVERTRPYFVEQPDEKQTRGHEGEIVLLGRRDGDGDFLFDIDNLRGSLDDGGLYRLTALVKDSMGQTDDDYIDFEVMWEHKASMPEATVVTENGVVKITPTVPEDMWEGDYCEIYRLSADTPQLIVPHATFGETYVDPFPTLGKFGGHRIVYRTTCGDFVTADKIIAWRDYEAMDDAEFPEVGIMEKKTIIDFGTGRVELDRNLDVDNRWEKDFVETSYLGGSIQGDWNPAVRRSGSSSTCSITLIDEETIKDMRRLAVFTGECHVRTPDGSSYAADVQVSESWSHDRGFLIAEYTLDITRVDGERYDGMTLDEWEADND